MDMLEEYFSQLSFQGTTGWLNFSYSAAAVQTSVEIFKSKMENQYKEDCTFRSINQLFLNRSMLWVIPSDMLNRVYVTVVYPIGQTVILSLMIVLFIALAIVSLCLFIYYHNNKDNT